MKKEKFHIEEKWPGIYYISKEGYIKIQLIVSRELSTENHIWLNSLSDKVDVEQAAELIVTTQELVNLDEKNYADSLWEIVASVNEETIQKVREDAKMSKALARIMKPEIDEAFNNGFNNGVDAGAVRAFKNMVANGIPKELAQKCAKLSDQLMEKALSEMQSGNN